MAKLSKEELKKKIDEKISDDDLKIELLEDIEDSFNDEAIKEFEARYEAEKAELEAQIANEKAYIMDLKARYKERFLKGSDEKEDIDDLEDTEMKEKEVIDIKEI